MRQNIAYQTEDTICAIATAPGIGGIAVVRVSGSEAINIVDLLIDGAQSLSCSPARVAKYTHIIYDGQTLDDVIVTVFRAPHSFTGEDTVEVACHGSIYIQEQILRALLISGCRAAEPGEFTMRAYLNGKMDLAQAEAVADLIAARSAAAHRLARKQMDGNYSHRLNALADELLHFASLMELELDFSEEDVEFADRTQLCTTCEHILADLSQLADTYAAGNAIRHGIPIAIVGATNVGKSTLLNALIGKDRAIVSNIAGTTRDTIEDTLMLGGITFRIVDTAGIRATTDEIEALGIERTYRQIEDASIILYLLDTSLPTETAVADTSLIMDRVKDKSMLLLLNKSDLNPNFNIKELPSALHKYPMLSLSAKHGMKMDELKKALIEMGKTQVEENDVVVSNARHYEALRQAIDAMDRVSEGLQSGLPTDLLSPDLRHGIGCIEEITGRQISSDAILHNIFAHFCIGK